MGKVVPLNSKRGKEKKEKCSICGGELIGDNCLECNPIPDFTEEFKKEKDERRQKKEVVFVCGVRICSFCKNPTRLAICGVCGKGDSYQPVPKK